MAIEKKRISEIPLLESLKGFFALGIDAKNKNAKVDLGFVEEAAELAKEIGSNPTYIGSDYYVYAYNAATHKYEKTNIYVRGAVGQDGKDGKDGVDGLNGGAEAVVYGSLADLEAATAEEGALAIVAGVAGGKTALCEGFITDKFIINTSITPVFDWSAITPDSYGSYAALNVLFADPTTAAPIFAVFCASDGETNTIYCGSFDSTEPTFLYISQGLTAGGTTIPAGWQSGVGLVDMGQKLRAKMSGEFLPDAPPLQNVIINFDDIFHAPGTAGALYVRLNGGWVSTTLTPEQKAELADDVSALVLTNENKPRIQELAGNQREVDFGRNDLLNNTQLIGLLGSMGAFSDGYWSAKVKFDYLTNPRVQTHSIGVLNLAGAVIECFGDSRGVDKIVRISTINVSNVAGDLTNCVVTYTYTDGGHGPIWSVVPMFGIDYSLLTEQEVPGVFFLDINGNRKQVYTRTFRFSSLCYLLSSENRGAWGVSYSIPGISGILSVTGTVMRGNGEIMALIPFKDFLFYAEITIANSVSLGGRGLLAEVGKNMVCNVVLKYTK